LMISVIAISMMLGSYVCLSGLSRRKAHESK
jgi:hypothetical protein